VKILHIVDYLMPTMGYQEFLLPKWNARQGHEVHIITSDRYTPVDNYDSTWGKFLGKRICGTGSTVIDNVNVHRLGVVKEFRFRPVLSGLTEKIKEINPEIIFCHGTASPAVFSAVRTAGKLNIPAVMDNHMTFGCQNLSFTGRIYYSLLKFFTAKILVPNVYKFLGVANECSDFLHKGQGIPKEKIDDLPIGIDTDLFSEDIEGRKRLRSENNIPESAKVVLQTGKLTPDKSPHYLSEAVAPLMKDDENIYLAFLGAGSEEYLEKIKQPLKENNVLKRVRFLPLVPVEKLPAIYSMADLCVYPDAASLSCMEASSCLRAVIMSDLPASKWRESLGVGKCYNTGNIEQLRNITQELLENNDKRESIAITARQAVIDNFSYKAISEKSVEIMRQAIAEKQ
jgi:glycosyltransferase involved in cell wall biosynthesis